MADEDDAGAVLAQPSQDAEDLTGLLWRQDRGRLVEDEDPRSAVDRLQDLDALLLSERQLVDARAGIDAEAQPLRELADASLRRPHVEDAADAADLLPEHDILRHAEDRHEHEVLVDHPDAARDRVRRSLYRDRRAIDTDLALVRRDEAVEDVHQGRLAGAVLTEERVDLAFAELEIDRVVRERAPGKALGDAAHLQDGCLVAHNKSGPTRRSARFQLAYRIRVMGSA